MHQTREAVNWLEFTEEKGLMQLMRAGTRGEKILDCIFSNSPNPSRIDVEVNKGLTDHRTVLMEYIVASTDEQRKGPVNEFLTTINEYNLDQMEEAQKVKLRARLS